MIKLNNELIQAKLYGSKFKLNLFGTLYADGNFAIIANTHENEEFAMITVNLPELRANGGLKPSEIAINHDLNPMDEYMVEIMSILTDQEPRFITFGMASSVAIVLKDEIIDKLLEIEYEDN